MAHVTGGNENIQTMDVIGRGGFGIVYKMKNRWTNEFFARKVMTEIAGQNDIANEVQAIARLFNDETAHSQINLVRIFGWGLLNPLEYSYYLDMELCAYDLHSQIRFAKEQREYIKAMVLTDATNSSHRYRRALSHVEYTVNILRDIMRGLRYLHSRELVHRDLKPANVLYSRTSKCWKLSDFGFTSPGFSDLAVYTSAARGTPGYRAPELLEEHPYSLPYTKKVDIWSFGVIVYALIVGDAPFNSDYRVSIYAKGIIQLERPLSPEDVHPRFWTYVLHDLMSLLDTCLSPDPSARPRAGKILQILDRLSQWCEDEVRFQPPLPPAQQL